MKNKICLENIFLIISLIFGLLFIFIVPSFQSPDESAHFLKAYEISKGDLFANKKNNIYGYCIPNDLSEYIVNKNNYMSNLDAKYSYSEDYYNQLLSFNYADDCTHQEIATQTVTVFAHIVPAIGIKVTNFVNVYPTNESEGPAVALQFARFACLIVYSLMCYFAIKITPRFKKTMFAMLLLPNALLLRTMVTYDGLLMATISLSLANMLKLICDKDSKFSKWHFIWFIFAAYILLNIKVVYSFIFLLMFAIPNERFGTKKDKIKKYVLMIVIALILVILGKIPYAHLANPESKIIAKQTSYITSHLLRTIGVLFNNIKGQFSFQMYWLFGTYGLLDTYMPVLFVFLLEVITLCVLIVESFTERLEIHIAYKILLGLFIILSLFGIYGIMYLSWTPKVLGKVGGSEVSGVQGRYFLPYLLMIPIVFSNKLLDIKKLKNIKKIFNKVSDWINNYYCYIAVVSLILSSIFLLLRFYV